MENRTPNALINETSPYLLQHAYNPVHWYPWGEEAFQSAAKKDVPVFLSIGYSTCHWCHVMEEESFEDREVADYLNAHFVCVKVDKEERPDIDAVYMGVCQALTGSGGWPTTILMTSGQKPFFAGTYFPKTRRYGQPGLLELLAAVSQQWANARDSLLQSSEKITAAMAGSALTGEGQEPDPGAVEAAAEQLKAEYSREYGGFGRAPKFPMPHNLLFLLRCHDLGLAPDGLSMVEGTLTGMYRGGIFDHIGFGFSRYSTDEKWLAPHFEKMLYDNALLVMALVDCYAVDGNPLHRMVAEKTLAYIAREMTAPEGGFYSAQDADIDGKEGKFYTFTPAEIIAALGEADAARFCEQYDITQHGNFEGKSIPNLIGSDTVLPDPNMERLLTKLQRSRESRYALHKDDKVLTSWNALMIGAYAKAYRVLGEREYLGAAIRGLDFIEAHLTDADGGLLISWRNGAAKGAGLLDDYAFLAWACLELYEAAFEVKHLKRACRLMEQILARFAAPDGGFYLSPDNGEALLFRPREQFDGAVPSGNSVAAWCLVQLAALTGESRWQKAADRQLDFYGPVFTRQPGAFTFALMALMRQVFPSRELVCVASTDEDREALALELGRHYHPRTTVLIKTQGDELEQIAPFTAEYHAVGDERYSFYLCENHSCSPPFHSVEELLARLGS